MEHVFRFPKCVGAAHVGKIFRTRLGKIPLVGFIYSKSGPRVARIHLYCAHTHVCTRRTFLCVPRCSSAMSANVRQIRNPTYVCGFLGAKSFPKHWRQPSSWVKKEKIQFLNFKFRNRARGYANFVRV